MLRSLHIFFFTHMGSHCAMTVTRYPLTSFGPLYKSLDSTNCRSSILNYIVKIRIFHSMSQPQSLIATNTSYSLYKLYASKATSHFFSILLLSLLAVAAFVRCKTKNYLRTQTLRYLAERHNCAPIKQLKDNSLLPFGLTNVIKLARADLQNRLPIAFAEGLEENGDTYSQRMFGDTMLLTRDPRNIKAILQNIQAFEVGTLRRNIFWPLLGAGIFTNDGVWWKRSRKLLTPIFKKPEIMDPSRLEPQVQDLLSTLREQSNTDQNGSSTTTINLSSALQSTWHKIAMSLLFGDLPSSTSEPFAEALNNTLQYLAERARFSALYFLKNNKSFRRDTKTVHSTLDTLISNPPGPETSPALSHILSTTSNPTVTRYELLNLLFAARDTSVAFTSWIFYALARSPSSFLKLKSEIVTVLGADPTIPPTTKHLAQLKYLDTFMAETLRLFPPIAVDGRMCSTHSILPTGGGEAGDQPIVVPAGTFVLYSILGLQRNTAIYGADAGRFRAERWEEVGMKERHLRGEWVPFNGGPRKCLGEQLAWLQVKYLVARILQRVRKIRVDGGEKEGGGNWVDEVKYRVDVGMSPEGGTRVIVEMEDD
ncbi:unnamed protein product [Periconia digitata]|uniref:Cytochrome P450 n=1 Tax=Periconia digitata TaxID=1303443 RepID=A0A9W4UMG2_9PLEO|nr:unnamed protein product [Periconia digitata]